MLAIRRKFVPVVRWTSADRQVTSHVALGPVSAAVLPKARIHAQHVDARVLARTVAVAVTADDFAAELSVPVVACAAATLRGMVGDVALGVRTTDVGQQAGINAVTVNARLVVSAFGVA